MIVLGALGGAAYGFLAPKSYQAQSTGFIATAGDAVIAGSDAAVARAGSYTPLIDSAQVREAIAKEAGVDVSDLSGALSADVVPGSTMIRVTATSSSPKAALELANGSLHALAAVVEEIEKAAGAVNAGGFTIVPMDNAAQPTSPVSPNLRLAVIAGAAAGLVLAYLVLFLRRALDVRVRADTDTRELMGAGVLARVPKMGRKGTPQGDSLTETVANEAFRQLRTSLRFANVDSEVRVVMVTSANQGEGKSMTASSLARVIAESGERTLIIDGDLRRPKVARNFGLEGTVGLSEVLSGQITVRDAVQSTDAAGLFALAAGGTPPNPSEMLGSSAFGNLIKELRKDFFIVIDAPPVLPVTDATVVSTMVDGVVFVLAVGQTRKTAGAVARAQLEQVNARVLGVVLNLVSLNGADGYGYGYGYRQNRNYYVTPKGKSRGKRKKQASAVSAPAVARASLVPAATRADVVAGPRRTVHDSPSTTNTVSPTPEPAGSSQPDVRDATPPTQSELPQLRRRSSTRA
ncbi:polysaccharide biosynthesis tyrosine autokinase [Microbacterium esteraromaticum]|nr:polysaccharide biosynthesis tyrosine autokinase [Microbacterium esteraromaticum]